MFPIRAVRIIGHCACCGSAVEAVGPKAQHLAGDWAAAHRAPVIDSLDIAAAFTGEPLGTWRRRC